jgi:hypothetical protein
VLKTPVCGSQRQCGPLTCEKPGRWFGIFPHERSGLRARRPVGCARRPLNAGILDASAQGTLMRPPVGGREGSMVAVASNVVEGHISPGFEAVADAFAENFARRGELGGACCAWVRGDKAVHIWGGVRTRSPGTHGSATRWSRLLGQEGPGGDDNRMRTLVAVRRFCEKLRRHLSVDPDRDSCSNCELTCIGRSAALRIRSRRRTMRCRWGEIFPRVANRFACDAGARRGCVERLALRSGTTCARLCE